jgi:3-oxosteroid 1-dehydrogenase
MRQAYDVVVLGSGAAGLTAALAAATSDERSASLVAEKAELLGGTTALSGGTIWIPANQPAREAGVEDSREQGLEYLAGLSNGMILPELAEALDRRRPASSSTSSTQHTDIRLQLVRGYPGLPPGAPRRPARRRPLDRARPPLLRRPRGLDRPHRRRRHAAP